MESEAWKARAELALENWVKELQEAPDEETRQWIGRTGGTAIGMAIYTDWLERFHTTVRPGIYLEIGVDCGITLKLAKSPTVVLGVDPEPKAIAPFPTETIIYAMTSDHYFLEPRPVHDMAFIDGLHLFEQALRDFINVEWYGHEGTIALIHDVLPQKKAWTTRDKIEGQWTGDTWKLIPILKQWRPELEVEIIATPPSGLAVITGLDPNNDILHQFFNEIVNDWMNVEWRADMTYDFITEKPKILDEYR